MNLCRSLVIQLPKKATVTAVAFHPTKAIAAIGLQNRVYCYYFQIQIQLNL